MSDALDKLIEAVEAGTFLMDVFPDGRTEHIAYEAFSGSFEASLALHEALLPGWIWGRQQNGAMWVASRPHTIRAPAPMEPARALLLVVLKAYRKTRG